MPDIQLGANVIEPSEAAGRITAARAILFDWDGCLANGEVLLPGAREVLQSVSNRSYILSNNSTSHPGDLASILERAGIELSAYNILLAGHQTLIEQAIRLPGRPIHLIAAPQMIAFATTLGISLDQEGAETMVILRDTGFTFEALTRAVNAARSCRKIILSNQDLTHPGPGNMLQPETGALFAAIQACLGDHAPAVEVVGKPSPGLFRIALQRAGIDAADAVMIGDNPATDGAGAAACGIPFIQVHPTGPLTMARLAEALPAQSAPEQQFGLPL